MPRCGGAHTRAFRGASSVPAHYRHSSTLLMLCSGFRKQPLVPTRSINRIMKLDLFVEILPPFKHASIAPPQDGGVPHEPCKNAKLLT